MDDPNEIIRKSHLAVITVGCPGTTHHAGMRPKNPLGLQHAIIDSEGIYALETLTTGEIKNWRDIEAAEIALRAFVLHDRVDWLLPAVLVTKGQITTNFFPEPHKIEAIETVIRSANTHHRTVYASSAVIMPGNTFYAEKFWMDNYPLVIYSPHEFAKTEINDAFAAYLRTDKFKTAFVATPTRLGAPSYFVNEALKRHEFMIQGQGGLLPPWLESLDAEWKKKLEQMKQVGIHVRIGPFLSIVLSRARNRDDITAAIIELREEMEHPRQQLWGLFEDVKNEPNFQKSLQKIEAIQKAAQSIIPAAFPKETSPIRFILNAIKTTSKLGAVVSICEHFLQKDEAWQQVHSIDAARTLTKSLRKVEGVSYMLQKHLTKAEQTTLGI